MRFASIAFRQSSMLAARNPLAGGPPALVTQISTEPNLSATASTKLCTAAASVTSKACVKTSALDCLRTSCAAASSFSRVRAHIATRHPSAAKAAAVSRPIPWLEAATIATRPRKPVSISSEIICREDRALACRAPRLKLLYEGLQYSQGDVMKRHRFHFETESVHGNKDFEKRNA